MQEICDETKNEGTSKKWRAEFGHKREEIRTNREFRKFGFKTSTKKRWKQITTNINVASRVKELINN